MIIFKDLSKETPYQLFLQKYTKALKAKQKNINAISVSSYNLKKNEIDSRYVNLKYVIKNEFIFFTNYNSPKSIAFELNNQVAALIFWPSINVQIRIKAHIKKTSRSFNKNYFKKRSIEKNALAISSNQSSKISSFQEVINKYNIVKNEQDLLECPKYWGGFSFTPYEIEFWEGSDFRLNKRDLYKKNSNKWDHLILEP